MNRLDEKVSEIKVKLEAGKTPSESVREILYWLDAQRRGRKVVKEIKKKLFRSAELFRLYFHSSSGNQGINVFLGNGNGIEIGKLIDELARDHRVFVGSFF